MSSGPGLLPRAMSGSMDLLQPVFELIFMASVTAEGYGDTQGLVSHLRPCWYPGAMRRPEPF